MGFISAGAFATILAVAVGLPITAAASFAHDIRSNTIKSDKHGTGHDHGEDEGVACARR
ncbi:hypothetical protein [Microbacterium soli]|uniref:Uncharacterized protein n=1 Tax=Microbacterium soli TaxID=446075 RepID=A0ABP7NBQ4_9MICO